MNKIALRMEIAKAIGAGATDAHRIARACRSGSFDDVCSLLVEEAGGWWTFGARGVPSWATWRLTGVGASAIA